MNKYKITAKRRKLCIVALGAYPLLAGIKTKNIVGPDVHHVVLAKEFAKYDISVSVIAHGEDGAPIEHVNGIEIVKIHKIDYQLRILDIFSKIYQIWNAMQIANTPIYFQAGGIPGIISIFCRLTGRKYIYENASDSLVNRKLVTRKNKHFSGSMLSIGTIGYWLDIKLADAIIVQNQYQLEMLKKNFGKDGILIKMPIPQKGIYKKANPPIVLWVGSIADIKQPELFVKLAKALPTARFQMIGGHLSNEWELYNTIKDAAKNVSNLEFLGVVPFNEIEEYFGRASILVNTSMFEGFPNAFIQAWMHYLPVVSLCVDPDGLINERMMGFCSKNMDQLISNVMMLLKDPHLREEMGMNARRYVETEHNINKIIKRYLDIFGFSGKANEMSLIPYHTHENENAHDP
jgi:glycosyltransferase involved in cell wall biosynthesis